MLMHAPHKGSVDQPADAERQLGYETAVSRVWEAMSLPGKIAVVGGSALVGAALAVGLARGISSDPGQSFSDANPGGDTGTSDTVDSGSDDVSGPAAEGVSSLGYEDPFTTADREACSMVYNDASGGLLATQLEVGDSGYLNVHYTTTTGTQQSTLGLVIAGILVGEHQTPTQTGEGQSVWCTPQFTIGIIAPDGSDPASVSVLSGQLVSATDRFVDNLAKQGVYLGDALSVGGVRTSVFASSIGVYAEPDGRSVPFADENFTGFTLLEGRASR